jgi:hypothetical protein
VVLPGFVLERFLSCPIPSVATEHPPAQTDHTSERNEESQAHEQPRRYPFADEKEHGAIIAKTMSALRV